MNHFPLNQDIAIAGQISISDVRLLRDQGFKTIICNRPDGEVAGQPTAQDIALEAEACGLNFSYVPVFPGSQDVATTDAFREALNGDKPVLAYCRTGHRSTILWALSQVGYQDNELIVATVKKAGFDFFPDTQN